MPLTISSSAFRHNSSIPAHCTCDEEDMTPPLLWSGVPAGTRSLVLIFDAPDALDLAAIADCRGRGIPLVHGPCLKVVTCGGAS